MICESSLKDPVTCCPNPQWRLKSYTEGRTSALCVVSGLRRSPDMQRSVAGGERRVSGRILRIEPDILRGEITAPHRGLAIVYAQVNGNANIPTL
jgi:hypothetical protein